MTQLHRVLLLCLFLLPTSVSAQNNDFAPCGVVDAIDYPIDTVSMISGTLSRGWDDFGRFRRRYDGIHVGLDVAFNRYGDPVYAAARGRVTYADPEGWDINRGVVIVEHVFPDDSITYSLYGHVEETETIRLPAQGTCVERGEIVGTVGDPEQGLPHLHYEIRRFLPSDGGPGYIDGNPAESGWLHPLDFTFLWQARLQPGFVDARTLAVVPNVPPVTLPGRDEIAVASANTLRVLGATGAVRWQITTDGDVIGLAALQNGQIVAHTENGQVLVLENGRYRALWTVDAALPLVVARQDTAQSIAFAAPDGNLTVFDASGATLLSLSGSGRPVELKLSPDGANFVYSVRRSDGYALWIVDASGIVTGHAELTQMPVFAPAFGGWQALAGGDLLHIAPDGSITTIAQGITPSPGRLAQMHVDRAGTTYIYFGDSGRTLMAIDSAGIVRWRERFVGSIDAAPLLATDTGCLLYMLDAAGTLTAFDALTGQLITVRDLYPGGVDTRRLSGRLLEVDAQNRVTVNPGFLSTVTFDGAVLGAGVLDGCLLG